MSKRVAIIIGHYVNKPNKGVRAFNGQYESKINQNIAKNLHNRLNNLDIRSTVIIKDDPEYLENIKAFDPDFCLELHLNAASVKAKGCEALALDEAESINLGDIITDEISNFLKIKQRRNNGVLVIKKGGRGHKNLKLIKDNIGCPCIIVEPTFVNFETEESIYFMKNQGLYVQALISGITKYISILEKKEERDYLPLQKLEYSPKSFYEKIVGLGKEIFIKKLY